MDLGQIDNDTALINSCEKDLIINTDVLVEDIHFNDEAILYIIDRYTLKEEGVRNLKRCLDRLLSKFNCF